MGLKDRLTELRDEGLAEIKNSKDLKKINEIRVKMLGKKGPITSVLRGMRDLSAEERPVVGQFANKVRDELTTAIEERRTELEQAALDAELAAETVDVTLPGTPRASLTLSSRSLIRWSTSSFPWVMKWPSGMKSSRKFITSKS